MRKLMLLSLIPLLGFAAMAKVTVAPGISFAAFTEPYLTLETTIDDLQSIKVFVGKEGLTASFRLWPLRSSAWPLTEGSIPTYVGFGMTSTWGDGMALAGFYAEVGIKLYNTVDLGFSLQQFGSQGKITLNLGLSFTLVSLGEGG